MGPWAPEGLDHSKKNEAKKHLWQSPPWATQTGSGPALPSGVPCDGIEGHSWGAGGPLELGRGHSGQGAGRVALQPQQLLP